MKGRSCYASLAGRLFVLAWREHYRVDRRVNLSSRPGSAGGMKLRPPPKYRFVIPVTYFAPLTATRRVSTPCGVAVEGPRSDSYVLLARSGACKRIIPDSRVPARARPRRRVSCIEAHKGVGIAVRVHEPCAPNVDKLPCCPCRPDTVHRHC